jgi:NTE family protein
MINKSIIADAVFEGGGVKGVGLVGALKTMEDAGYSWRNVAGTSAGSIVAALVAAGYDASETEKILKGLDYKKMKDVKGIDIPFFTEIKNLLFDKGIYRGDYIKEWIDTLLSAKFAGKLDKNRSVKFKDLIIPNEEGILIGNKKYKRKYKLHIIATDITRGKMLILPEDIADYGLDPDELDVSLAVRMSISIPLFFEPAYIKNFNYKSGSGSKWKKSVIVDGGVLSNYPVWLFDVKGVPTHPTIGFRLGGSKNDSNYNNIRTSFSLSLSVLQTMLDAQDEIHIEEMEYLRTIKIDTLGVSATDFGLTKEQADALFISGQKCAKSFLENWDENFKKHKLMRQDKVSYEKYINKD